MASNRRTSNWLYGLALSGSLALSGGLLGFVSPAAHAQSVPPSSASTVDPLQDFHNPDGSSDPFSGRGDNSSSIFNLIHQAMQGGFDVDRAAETSEQRESITDAAAAFRAKQRQLLKPSQPTSNTTAAPLPADMSSPAMQPSAPTTAPVP